MTRTLGAAALLLAASALNAQDRPTLTPADYGRFETLGGATLSPDGAWLAWGIDRVNQEDELRYRRVGGDDTARVVPYGSRPAFAPDSRHLAYLIGVSEAERERLEEKEEPVRMQAALVDLATGDARVFDDVASVAFDATGRFLALHGYAPEEPEGKGADVRLVDTRSGDVVTFGNAGSLAWSDRGSLLALAIATGGEVGNGVQVYDAATGRLRGLESSSSGYDGLAWREDAPDLAVFRTVGPAGSEEPGREVVAWRGVDRETPRVSVLDSSAVADSLEIVGAREVEWGPDGSRISFGLRPREADEGDEGDDGEGEQGSPADSAGAEALEHAEVEIWHSADVRIVPQQQAMSSADERRSVLAVWHLDEGRVVPIGSSLMEYASLLEGWERALEHVEAPYPWGAMFGRPYRDVWAVDVGTGERRRVAERVRYAWPSDGGRWLVTFDGRDYWSHDLARGGDPRNLTGPLPTVFADTAYDTPTDVTPPHSWGPAGWLEGDRAVLLNDEHDVWRVALDGSGGARLTRGAEEEVVHRVARLEEHDDEPGLDPRRPLYYTLYGRWTKERGYARGVPGLDVERLVYRDRNVGRLERADSADVYVYRVAAWDDSPDLFVGGPRLADARQMTETNPFQSEYAWGRAGLVDFESEAGRRLQAALYYPADYEPGRRYPMIVYTYEMLSPGIHNYAVPTERRYYNPQVWTQQGYAVLMPDIVYRARDPGISALEAVRPAVAKVVEMGVADEDRVGLIGHSWGGYQATFLPTRTDIFAASVAGAPLTDFVSFMGAIHWNPGIPEVDHWETGQARMEVPFWEDPEAHRRNSPIHEVHNLDTPLLMAFGNEDGVVDWDQGTEFYNFARRAGKQMVLLVYEGEDHGFRQEKNQRDYHRRILEWFGHYLKGDPAPRWITEGVPASEMEDEARRIVGGERGR